MVAHMLTQGMITDSKTKLKTGLILAQTEDTSRYMHTISPRHRVHSQSETVMAELKIM